MFDKFYIFIFYFVLNKNVCDNSNQHDVYTCMGAHIRNHDKNCRNGSFSYFETNMIILQHDTPHFRIIRERSQLQQKPNHRFWKFIIGGENG